MTSIVLLVLIGGLSSGVLIIMEDQVTSIVLLVLIGGLSSGVFIIMAIIYHPNSLSPSVTSNLYHNFR